MKSRTKKAAPNANGPEKVAYILPQGNLSFKARKSGRPSRNKMYNPSGFVLIGMYDSLGKTFTSREAAVQYAEKHGFKVKTNRSLRNPRTVPPNVVATITACAILASEP